MRNLILSTLTFTTLFGAHAKEGLDYIAPKNKNLQAWNNTFMYTLTKKNAYNFTLDSMGTVSALFKKETTDGAYIGLITAKHVVVDKVNLEGRLFRNMKYNTVINLAEEMEELTSFKIMNTYTSLPYDLGLLVIKVSQAEAKTITPHKLTEKCNYGEGSKLSIIGFPAVMYRNKTDQVVPIPLPNIITKRISEGRYVEDYISNENGPMVATTADAMPGNSGGPVLDEKGYLMGVQAAVKFAGLKYHGHESRKYLIGHSWIVECKKMKEFALKSWDEFLLSAPE